LVVLIGDKNGRISDGSNKDIESAWIGRISRIFILLVEEREKISMISQIHEYFAQASSKCCWTDLWFFSFF
jgi:hypothetical protein